MSSQAASRVEAAALAAFTEHFCGYSKMGEYANIDEAAVIAKDYWDHQFNGYVRDQWIRIALAVKESLG